MSNLNGKQVTNELLEECSDQEDNIILVPLTLTQVQGRWNELGPRIASTLQIAYPEEDIDRLIFNVHSAITRGNLQCWVACPSDNQKKILGIMTTVIQHDGIAGIKNMLIYSVTGIEFLENNIWEVGYNVLAEQARRKGCSRIIAYSGNERVLRRAKALGGRTDTHVVEMEV